MDDLSSREHSAEQHVHGLLKNQDEPILNILQALEDYRQLSQKAEFAEFENAAHRHSTRLWVAHTDTRKLLHRALADIRKKNEPVAARQLTKLYLQFIKDSQRFYREYVYSLNIAVGGIPELEEAAHKVKNEPADESLPVAVTPGVRTKALEQCHHALIYLGDLSRYRASDKLDKNPDYGPAIGFYGLAASLFPSSGMGHHQQAVVALEQRYHLRAIYHLYRAIVVDHPHPNARNNLRLEFEKTNAAWDRGELIQKAKPGDQDASRQSLIGWFVRLHSMCVKGEQFRGFEELEREVFNQLASEIQQRSLDSTLNRMLLVNFAAQHVARENFEANPTDKHQLAFRQFFRINIQAFTTLIRIFIEDLRSVQLLTNDDDEPDLAARLTSVSRRLLPALRLYSIWLLPSTPLLAGLAGDSALKDAIDVFWPNYAQAIDLVIHKFPIWDLEDALSPLSYMLEEDVETLGFQPLTDDKTQKVWFDKTSGMLKPRFSAREISRLSVDEEILIRLQDFLKDGLFLANDDDDAPIELRGDRVLLKGAPDPVVLPIVVEKRTAPVLEKLVSQQVTAPPAPPKPLTWAAVTANGHAKADPRPKEPSQANRRSRQAELSRMVDNLVDDEHDNHIHDSGPVTPPQQPKAAPVVAARGSDRLAAMANSDPHVKTHARNDRSPRASGSYAGFMPLSPGSETSDNTSHVRPPASESIQRLWGSRPYDQAFQSPQLPVGSPKDALRSPTHMGGGGPNHSRMNSANSIHISSSPKIALGSTPDNWSLPQPTPRNPLPDFGSATLNGLGSSYSAFESPAINQPLLFGAGRGLWSANAASTGVANASPPNGQGG